jgi:hypothetical protein
MRERKIFPGLVESICMTLALSNLNKGPKEMPSPNTNAELSGRYKSRLNHSEKQRARKIHKLPKPGKRGL